MELGDRWATLPAANRAAFHARRAAEGRWPFGAAEGWQRGRRWQPSRPLVFDTVSYARLGEVAARLLRLAVDACRRRASTAGELRALMTDQRPLRLLDHEQPLSHESLLRVARPDVLVCQGVARFVELNIAIPLYGIPTLDQMAAAYARLWTGDSLGVAPPVLRARSSLLAQVARGPARVLVPTWRSAGGQARKLGSRRALRMYLRPTVEDARACGLEIIMEDLSRLRTDAGGHLLARGQRVDLVFNWFVSAGIVDDNGGIDALNRAQAAGTVRLFFPESMRLLSSKQVLAWLHEDLNLLPPPDRDLVLTHVPRTTWAGPQQAGGERAAVIRDAITERQRLVLKPATGSSGNGVVFGSDVDPGTWRDLLSERSRQETIILQQRVRPDQTTMDFLDPESGHDAIARLPYVLAPFLIAGRICGALVRHHEPDAAGAPVINTGTGALANTILLSN
ncbi:hypothetical protein [Amycolatopsis taiwanensis]|uniref:hypothetical protein n=1 Tax=Amycolatopsis taiwanensis TaxID=342230 RepID=UPI0004B270AA|nr:hypothetical protein [Amycolatopsis taiwanensis]